MAQHSVRTIFDEADCIVAMGRDHQEAVQQLFGLSIPLFNQLCCDRDEPILDLHEAISHMGTGG
jgi:protein-tyrosine-phosphatase